MADPTRVRIVRVLATTAEEACLCELVDSLLEPPYKLSRHLKILKQGGLLNTQRDGRWVYHRLVEGRPYLMHLYAMIKSLPDAHRVFAADVARFQQRMRLREGGRCRVGIQTSRFAIGDS